MIPIIVLQISLLFFPIAVNCNKIHPVLNIWNIEGVIYRWINRFHYSPFHIIYFNAFIP